MWRTQLKKRIFLKHAHSVTWILFCITEKKVEKVKINYREASSPSFYRAYIFISIVFLQYLFRTFFVLLILLRVLKKLNFSETS